MIRTYKYRIYANNSAITNMNNWIELCRNLYNCALYQHIMIYKQNKGNISAYQQMNQLPELKRQFVEYQNIDSQVLQDVIKRLEYSFLNFYRRIKRNEIKSGYPRYKSISRYNSFNLKQHSWKLDGKYLIIKKIGRLKLKLSRQLLGNIKYISIKRSYDNKWYAYFYCDNIKENKLESSNKIIGIDVGITHYLVDSNNNSIDSPKYLLTSSKLLRKHQRSFSRKQYGSTHRIKSKLLISKLYRKISNQRYDFLHKLSNTYIKNYGIIVVEKLHLENMIKNHSLSRSILDSGWGIFFHLLSYKAEEAGRILIKIPPENTSKTCSECGEINKDLTLNNRKWICKSCGTLHDRDFNAAKNILMAGQAKQALTCADTQSVACKSVY